MQHFESIWARPTKGINIVVVENFRSKTKFLAYQQEQGGHLRVAKEQLQELEVD